MYFNLLAREIYQFPTKTKVKVTKAFLICHGESRIKNKTTTKETADPKITSLAGTFLLGIKSYLFCKGENSRYFTQVSGNIVLFFSLLSKNE